MNIQKTSSGTSIQLSKQEWLDLGKQAGFTDKFAQAANPVQTPSQGTPSASQHLQTQSFPANQEMSISYEYMSTLQRNLNLVARDLRSNPYAASNRLQEIITSLQGLVQMRTRK